MIQVIQKLNYFINVLELLQKTSQSSFLLGRRSFSIIDISAFVEERSSKVLENDKDSSIISNTNKDTKVNFERLLSTTLFSIKSVKHLTILNQRSMYKRASEHELETHALAALEPVVYDLFLVETLLELVRYNKVM
ncbi:unnamed protein product [Rotaria sordida]|uniref:Uncharacterized protein n=1 Tax=Rotaria sordida TaxID=392033 RepID=A0A816AFQ8_9BILA|nr:unnamed protein product [Rotaria sordida]CAF1597082.1 unnamed protein product [Rotaria sordida]